MMKYDRKNVDEFVEDVKSKLNPEDLLRLFLATAWQQRTEVGKIVLSNAFGDFLAFWDEFERWEELTTWERANAIFALAPLVEEAISTKARELVEVARKEKEGE